MSPFFPLRLAHAGHAHVGDLVTIRCGKPCLRHRGLRWFLKSLSNLNVPSTHDVPFFNPALRFEIETANTLGEPLILIFRHIFC